MRRSRGLLRLLACALLTLWAKQAIPPATGFQQPLTTDHEDTSQLTIGDVSFDVLSGELLDLVSIVFKRSGETPSVIGDCQTFCSKVFSNEENFVYHLSSSKFDSIDGIAFYKQFVDCAIFQSGDRDSGVTAWNISLYWDHETLESGRCSELRCDSTRVCCHQCSSIILKHYQLS